MKDIFELLMKDLSERKTVLLLKILLRSTKKSQLFGNAKVSNSLVFADSDRAYRIIQYSAKINKGTAHER